jgi:hypothetical protein
MSWHLRAIWNVRMETRFVNYAYENKFNVSIWHKEKINMHELTVSKCTSKTSNVRYQTTCLVTETVHV